MRFKQTNGQDFKEWCKHEYPNTFITKIGNVTESEELYSYGVKVIQIPLEIEPRIILINKMNNQITLYANYLVLNCKFTPQATELPYLPEY